jgi:hypothetical protein
MERVARHAPRRTAARGIETILDFLRDRFAVITSLLVAFVLGQQIVSPQTRTIKAALGLFVVLLLLLAPSSFGLSFFILMFPFPAYTAYGSTNTMLLFLLTIFWLLRVSTGQMRMRGKTGYDAFIMAMVITLCVSLYNAPDAGWRARGVVNLFFYFGAFLLFYLADNHLGTREDLNRATLALTIASFLIFLTVVVEVFFPYATIIPGWIGVEHTYGEAGARRMGGIVGGHDVLADFCVLLFPLILFRFYRASTLPRRLFYALLLVLDLFSLVSTANRGGLIGFLFCNAYMIWLTRREFKVVRYTVVGIALVVGFIFFDDYLSSNLQTVSLFDRVAKTHVEKNLVPDTRTEVWEGGWEGFTKHVLLGNGPWFDYKVIPQTHNGFLWSLVCVGVIGTVPYVLLLLKLLRESGRRLRGHLEKGGYVSGLMTVFHVQVATFLLVQMRTDYQRSPSYVYLMWLTFGFIVVASRILDAEKDPTPAP